MKNKVMKKHLALILALVLLAAVSLSAAADSAYDSYVVGSWSCYAAYDSEKDSYDSYTGPSLVLSGDGTCVWTFAGETMTGTWKYISSEKTGYAYSMTVSVWDSTATVVFLYSTSPELNGDLAVSVGNTIYLYRK